MPIHLITGIPGDGKTLRLVELLVEANKRNESHVASGEPQLEVNGVQLLERPIYAGGINGLKPGLARSLPNPALWNEIDHGGEPTCNCPAMPRPHAHVIPDGSVLYIDESWQWFGHLQDAARQQTPKHVLEVAIHRHRALDFVMTTQGGNQIYPFIRPLVATHEHLVRTLGFPISTRYEWPKFQDSTDSDKQKEAAPVSERWRHPKEIYSLYKSASGHTIKGKVPKKMWLLIVPMLLLVVSAYIGYQRVFKAPGEDVAKPKKGLLGEVATDKAKGGSDVTPEESRAAVRPTTAEEWRVALTPVVPGLPFTAPLFADKLEVVAHPQIFCAISGAEYDDLLSSHCSCLTEQGTRPSDIPDGLCRAIALNGYYDPTRAPRDDAASSASFVASDAGSVGASVVVSGDPAQIGSTSMGLVQGR